jgi:3-deoxy-D-manno-octulosonic-acid transferase
VIFGPKYTNFKEAVDLVALQGAFPVHNATELEAAALRLMDDEAFYAQASMNCRRYLESQVGATKIIMQGFEKTLFY